MGINGQAAQRLAGEGPPLYLEHSLMAINDGVEAQFFKESGDRLVRVGDKPLLQ